MFKNNVHHSHQSVRLNSWRQPSLHIRQSPPRLQQPMRIKGSLTQFIQRQAHQKLQVAIIDQSWRVPLLYEQRALNMGARRAAWIREVILMIDQEAWVYARTVIPKASLKGRWSVLKHLQQQPLGHLLFYRQRCERGVIKTAFTHLPAVDISGSTLPEGVATGADTSAQVWARYSIFKKRYPTCKASNVPLKRTKKMLVSEYFLPAFMRDY